MRGRNVGEEGADQAALNLAATTVNLIKQADDPAMVGVYGPSRFLFPFNQDQPDSSRWVGHARNAIARSASFEEQRSPRGSARTACGLIVVAGPDAAAVRSDAHLRKVNITASFSNSVRTIDDYKRN